MLDGKVLFGISNTSLIFSYLKHNSKQKIDLIIKKHIYSFNQKEIK
jgi:hypothetical protein